MSSLDPKFAEWLRRQAVDPAQISPEQLAMYRHYYDESSDPIDVNNRLRHEFINYGLQYYVAGRCAVATSLNPVAANLIPHAVEMFLTAGLCAHTNERQRALAAEPDSVMTCVVPILPMAEVAPGFKARPWATT